jgi:hypothetical protein
MSPRRFFILLLLPIHDPPDPLHRLRGVGGCRATARLFLKKHSTNMTQTPSTSSFLGVFSGFWYFLLDG